MDDTLKLTDAKVLEQAHDNLREHVPLSADGYQCTTDDLLNALLGMAVNRTTLEAVCADLGLPEAEALRRYFNDQLQAKDLPKLERRLNLSLIHI